MSQAEGQDRLPSIHDPTISVVIITYNQKDTIHEAFGSVVSQDYLGNWEIIVADDCSKDGTTRILQTLAIARQRPSIRLLTSPQNLGAARNSRRALEAARGTYVAYLDGDDYWTDASKLAIQAAYLDSHPECAAVGHSTRIIERETDSGDLRFDFQGRKLLTRSEVLKGEFPHLSSLMFRRLALPTTPLWFDRLRGNDWLMCCLLAEAGDIGMIELPMSVYRRNEQSSWYPLPFAIRKTDILCQKLALRSHVPSTCDELTSKHLEPLYSVVFSALLRSKSPRLLGSLAGTLYKEDPSGFSIQLARWFRQQTATRVRKMFRYIRSKATQRC